MLAYGSFGRGLWRGRGHEAHSIRRRACGGASEQWADSGATGVTPGEQHKLVGGLQVGLVHAGASMVECLCSARGVSWSPRQSGLAGQQGPMPAGRTSSHMLERWLNEGLFRHIFCRLITEWYCRAQSDLKSPTWGHHEGVIVSVFMSCVAPVVRRLDVWTALSVHHQFYPPAPSAAHRLDGC